MTKAKVLALFIGVALLFIIPATVSAQAPPVHVFLVNKVNGTPPADGTVIAAVIGGAQVASKTAAGGAAALNVSSLPGEPTFDGKTVSFTIDGVAAAESKTFVSGGLDIVELTAAPAAAATPAGAVLNLILYEDNKSGQYGTATLTEVGSQTRVDLNLYSGTLKSALVHIHTGQCGPTLGGVQNALTSFVGGSGASTTTVAATLASLQDGNHAINSHDASNAANYTSCASIPKVGEVQTASGSALLAVTGPAGPAGRAGVKGDKGDTGPKGDKGDRGVAGAAGATGAAGAKGDKGDTGAAGDRGAAGAAGGAGALGAAGPEGDDASNVLGIIAIILGAVAIVAWVAAFLMMRKKGAAPS